MKKILIANRGEIARRVMRTCREMGMRTVAVFSEPDRDGLFVREADEAVPLAGSSSTATYLNIDALLDAARRTGADAVHPGYGFLSENAEFARRCGHAGLTFIGPTPEAIAAMGSKIEAKRRMQDSGVSVLPSIAVAHQTPEELARQAADLGPAILVKASAGGGGRGMRIVRAAADLYAAVEAAKREALSAFGDETVFLEPYVDAPRHIEVQIFGDTHGNIVHLLERECSIQRRHQKIVEEAPSLALDEHLRSAICSAAVRAGEAIGYVGAGTVEFLLAPDRRFYFLEVNTRLQVEHPVTEAILGLDLVRLQILVAQGYALPPEVWQAKPCGHAIEVRLYAEDPRKHFAPSTGMLHRFRIPAGPGVRVESGVGDGSTVSSFYDPMLAKVIVHAPTRSEAARAPGGHTRPVADSRPAHQSRTAGADSRAPRISGRRNRYAFSRAACAGGVGRPLVRSGRRTIARTGSGAGGPGRARAGARCCGQSRPAGATIPRSQSVKFHGAHGDVEVEYQFSRGQLSATVAGQRLEDVKLDHATPERVCLEVDRVGRSYDVHHVDGTTYVDSPLGSSALCEYPRFPQAEEEIQAGSLVAPLPGVVDDVRVVVGDTVAAGDVLVVIESMKMLYPVTAPTAGRVTELRVQKSAHVEARTVLAVIEEA